MARTVVTLNTADVGGGAERIAAHLVAGYRARDWDSWFVVGDRKGDDPQTVPVWGSPHVDAYAEESRVAALRRRSLKRALPALGLEDHEFPPSHRILEAVGVRPHVVHAHNLHGPWFDLRALRRLSAEVPVIVSMHDSWLFTGHCAHPGACERWRTGCGRCPDLRTTPAVRRDATRLNLARKRRFLTGARLHLGCPSQVTIDRVQRSVLADAGAVAEIRHIPYGIDTDLFGPGDPAGARARVGVPAEEVLLLFVAKDADTNGYKDPATVEEAARRVAAGTDRPVRLVILGAGGAPVQRGGVAVERRGVVPAAEVADWMRAADVLVHAATDETYALVLVEALASGTPVVATDVGGVREALGGFGTLVARGDHRALGDAVLATLAGGRRAPEDAVALVRRRNSLAGMVDAYSAWCEELLLASGGATVPQ